MPTDRITTFSSTSQHCGCSSVDRVLASEAKGRGFDPRQPHQCYSRNPESLLWNPAINARLRNKCRKYKALTNCQKLSLVCIQRHRTASNRPNQHRLWCLSPLMRGSRHPCCELPGRLVPILANSACMRCLNCLAWVFATELLLKRPCTSRVEMPSPLN